MTIANFIPAVWSANILVALRKVLVFAGLVNADYEGDITGFGDRVKINEIGEINISDYTKNSDITWQDLDDAQKELIINQAKYFAFQIDDIDRAQAKPKLITQAMSDGAYGLKDAADAFMASKHNEAGIVTGLGTNAILFYF